MVYKYYSEEIICDINSDINLINKLDDLSNSYYDIVSVMMVDRNMYCDVLQNEVVYKIIYRYE